MRDVLSQRWLRTEATYERANAKRVYYLSMEFLIGRSLSNNLVNLQLDEFVARAAREKKLDWLAIVEQEVPVHEELLRGHGAPAPDRTPGTAPPSASSARPKSGPPMLALRRVAPATADATEAAIADVLNENLLAAMSRDRGIAVVEQRRTGEPPPAPTYVLEGTVPKGYPEPGLFQQSMGWVDRDGNGIRYQIIYSNSYHALGVYPVPPIAGATGGAGTGTADPAGAGR